MLDARTKAKNNSSVEKIIDFSSFLAQVAAISFPFNVELVSLPNSSN